MTFNLGGKVMLQEDMVSEVEYLTHQLDRLVEARELAQEVSPRMLPDLNRLHRGVLDRLKRIFSQIFGRRSSLGAVPPKQPLELLERLFASVRSAAEMAYAKASKAHGPQGRRLTQEAMELAELARTAAEGLKLEAEHRGVWTRDYIREHGLEPWI
jgi:hypothetical protein